MRKSLHRIGALAVACVCALTTATQGTPAPAAEEKPGIEPAQPSEPVPGGFGSWQALIAEQDRLNAGAQRLHDGASRHAGFTGLESAPENHRVRLFWHGQMPQDMTQLVESVRQQVAVQVVPAPHPLAELTRQQQLIAAEQGVTGVGPRVDGSALVVAFRGSEAQARALPSIASRVVS